MSNLVTKLTIAALLAGASTTAMAGPGNGIRLGGSEGRLHPFVQLEGRYDSNVYVTETGSATSDVIIHVRPGLTLSVPGEMTSVDLSGKLDFAQYLGNDETATKDLSGLYGDAALGISVNRKGVVGLEVNDTFIRSDRPQSLSFSSALVSNYNVLEVSVPWRPGGGALTLDANVAWSMESYEAPFNIDCSVASPDPLCNVADLGYNDVRGGVGAAWKFLPRTSALLEGTYFSRTPNDTTVSTTGNSTGYHLWAGLTGLVTPHVAATLKAGYGGISSDQPSLGSFLANVEGEWLPSETASVKLGYTHDLRVDPTVLYTTDRVALSARQLVAGRVALGITGSWEQLAYSDPGTGSTAIMQVTPSVGVDVTRWLKAEVSYAYTDRANSADATAGGTDYAKNEAWLKATATY